MTSVEPASPGISEYWRKNTSPFEPVELANLLRALRKVAGHLGPNVGRIEYAGMSRDAEAAIVLDPSLVAGRYPIPPEKVDYLVGVVVHEALQRIEWTERVWTLLEPTFGTLQALSLVRFQKIVHMGEKIYVDSIAERSAFGLYTATSREQALIEARAPTRASEPCVDALVCLWWAQAWQAQHCDCATSYAEPLAVLGRLTEGLREVAGMKAAVTQRCQRRAELYRETWQDVQALLLPWRVTNRALHWYPSILAPENTKRDASPNNLTAPTRVVSPAVLQQTELQLAMDSADITPIIQSIVGYEGTEVARTSWWDSRVSASTVIDPRLVARLRAIFRDYSPRKQVVSRGLLSGRVDARRLYRAPVSGRCFRQVDTLADPDWTVALLMDASGSMRGSKLRMVEHTVANLHRALAGFRSHLQAYAYFEIDGVCMIAPLLKDGQLLSVPPSGQTASGQAIIAAAYGMPRGRKRDLLIHVTDGESNFGCEVRYGIQYCRKRHIHLITLGCGYKEREAMLRQYGKSLQFLDHFGQLPPAIERLLKWTFLYGERSQAPTLLGASAA